jgi:hypothetical protein
MSKSIEAMRAAIRDVHTLLPTAANAARLTEFYNQAYLDDDALLSRVCQSKGGIDGLTEQHNADDLLGYMQMPETLTLEHGLAGSPGCNGFIIVRWATSSVESRAAFRDYFLTDVFDADRLVFESDNLASRFDAIFESGSVVYIAEIVTNGEPGITLALIAAAYFHVRQKLAVDDFAVLGKCLRSARIGSCSNELGNQPIQAFVTGVGLNPIGRCVQLRHLNLSQTSPRLNRAFPEGLPTEVFAELEFGLYLGDARGVAAIAATVNYSQC